MNELTLLSEYIQDCHPAIYTEFKRFNTPHYYEGGVKYHPITSGFRCGSGGSMEPFKIVSATPRFDGSFFLTLNSTTDPSFSVSTNSDDIHKQFVRFDEDVKPIGNPIKLSKSYIHVTQDGVEFYVSIYIGRTYQDLHSVRVTVNSPSFRRFNNGQDKEYFNLYVTAYGDEFYLEHVNDYDTIRRKYSNLYRNISIKDFKQKVFGNPSIKLKCDIYTEDTIIL